MPGPDDVIYQASVDDKTGSFFDRFDKRVTDTSTKASAAFDKMGGGLGKFGAIAGVIGGVVGGVVGTLASTAIQAAARFGDQVLGLIQESAQLRARADELATTLKLVGSNAGYSADELKTVEDGLRNTGISIIESRQAMAQWIQSNLDLGKASEVARTAQDAAVIAGVNSSEAFQRITHAIITMQPELLRSLGLIVDSRDAYEKYAKSIGKTAGALSANERQQAFMNAVLEKGKTVAGAYEAAMGEVGKQQRSLVRLQEDLKIAFGGLFQGVMRVQVERTTELIKKLAEWLENNQDAIEELGDKAGMVFGLILDLLEKIGSVVIKLPGSLKQVAADLLVIMGIMDQKDAEERVSKAGQAAKQLAAILIGVFTTAGQLIGHLLSAIGEDIEALWAFLKREITFQEMIDRTNAAEAELKDWGSNLQGVFSENVRKAGEFTGAIETADKATDDLGNTAKQTANDVGVLSDAFGKANESLAEFYYQMQQDVLEQQIQEQRAEIEAALREAWRLEDLARRRNEQINQILQNANDAQEQALRQSAQNKLDIERNYRRQLRDIQDRFEYDASELARARDAIGLLRLMRQKKREMAEAKKARDDAVKDNQINYKRQLAEIDRQRQEQLQRLEDQFAREEEEFQRNKDREKQIQDLHDRWEDEDRKRQYAKRLADLLKNLKGMEGITDTELDALYTYWETYFGDLLTLAQQKQAEITAIIQQSATDATNAFNNMNNSGYAPGTHIYPGQTPTGQDAQVSQLLANPSWITPRPTKASMSPTTQRSSDSRQLEVIVRGEAMDPYIQRQLALALMEIERNRS